MGTYTTNYQLYIPTVGETGWGTLVNANFTTIDTTMKSLSNRITAVENEVNGALSCTSVTTSGKITGNGGIAGTTGTFSGAVTGATFNGVAIKTGVYTVTPTNTVVVTNMYRAGFSDMDSTPTILPFNMNGYTGSIKFQNTSASSRSITYMTEQTNTLSLPSLAIPASSSTASLTFTDIHFLKVITTNTGVNIYGYKLT